MKNKTPMLDQRNQNKILNWLYQEEEKDDFLMGITPQNFDETWEDDE